MILLTKEEVSFVNKNFFMQKFANSGVSYVAYIDEKTYTQLLMLSKEYSGDFRRLEDEVGVPYSKSVLGEFFGADMPTPLNMLTPFVCLSDDSGLKWDVEYLFKMLHTTSECIDFYDAVKSGACGSFDSNVKPWTESGVQKEWDTILENAEPLPINYASIPDNVIEYIIDRVKSEVGTVPTVPDVQEETVEPVTKNIDNSQIEVVKQEIEEHVEQLIARMKEEAECITAQCLVKLKEGVPTEPASTIDVNEDVIKQIEDDVIEMLESRLNSLCDEIDDLERRIAEAFEVGEFEESSSEGENETEELEPEEADEVEESEDEDEDEWVDPLASMMHMFDEVDEEEAEQEKLLAEKRAAIAPVEKVEPKPEPKPVEAPTAPENDALSELLRKLGGN